MFLFRKPSMPDARAALPGRDTPVFAGGAHDVNGRPITGPYPEGTEIADFAMGCFWGAEKVFWSIPGVWVTAVGYQGGTTPNPPTRRHALATPATPRPCGSCSTRRSCPTSSLLKLFWEDHDPTQGYRQGNDVGTQYRSAIFTHGPEQLALAEASRDAYQACLTKAGYGPITTEIREAPAFYFAEDYHQQYLSKVPNGYCPNHRTGVRLPADFAVTPLQYVD